MSLKNTSHHADTSALKWQFIYIIKGLAIILVVIGHYSIPSAPAYWKNIHDIVYLFHMHVYFFISGYLFSLTPINSFKEYPGLVAKKFKRLMFPFLSIGLLLFIVKFLAGLFVPLQNPVRWESLFVLFIDPLHSHVTLLWFIYCLFFVFLVFPLLVLIFKNSFWVTLLSIGLFFVPWPQDIFLARLFTYLPFFSLGYWLAQKKVNPDTLRLPAIIAGIMLSAVMFGLFFWGWKLTGANSTFIDTGFRLLLGIGGAAFILFVSVGLVKTNLKPVINSLEAFGLYSMSIYLLHTVFESFIRILFNDIFYVNCFLGIAIIAVIAGLFFPFWLEKYVLRKVFLTRYFFLGLK
jgi:fucose 4-O-acetylase-like acetyltransferase